MTRPDPIPDALFEEAAIWHARMREPVASAAHRPAFERWLHADPRHADAYDEVLRLWDALEEPVAEEAAAHPIRPFSGPRPAVTPARSRRAIPRRAALAAGVALALLGGGWLGAGGFDTLRADRVTAVGGRDTLSLADGSAVDLNTDTALSVDLNGTERRVRLYRGEAFFAVARDPDRPFTVETDDGAVRVLGTRFNVRAADGRTEVAVTGGMVRVVPASGDAVVLAAGQAGRLAASGAAVLPGLDPEAVTAWRRGQLVFYREPLGRVVEELNRYHPGRIAILDDALAQRPVTGVFDTTRPVAVVDLIEATLDVRSIRVTEHLILLR